MKDFLAITTFLFAIWISYTVNVTILTQIDKITYKFYDSNGKEIPYNIVDLLVKDQFVHLDSNEYKQLDKHFYYRKTGYSKVDKFQQTSDSIMEQRMKEGKYGKKIE